MAIDIATEAALRAIVAGLRKSGAISDEPHVVAIVRELEAVEKEVARYGTAEQSRLRRLCMDIAGDAGVSTTIQTAEPPLDYRH